MALFFFAPGKPVEVVPNPNKRSTPGNEYPIMTYVYVGSDDTWRIRDPKSGTWINYDTLGVPEAYRAQVLLLTAAYD